MTAEAIGVEEDPAEEGEDMEEAMAKEATGEEGQAMAGQEGLAAEDMVEEDQAGLLSIQDMSRMQMGPMPKRPLEVMVTVLKEVMVSTEDGKENTVLADADVRAKGSDMATGLQTAGLVAAEDIKSISHISI